MIKFSLNILRSCLSGVCLILLSIVIVYSPILNDPFETIYDANQIVENVSLHQPGNIAQSLTRDLFRPEANYRPLADSSYIAVGLSFGRSAFAQHLLNILLHAATALLIFAIMTALTNNRMLGLLTALLFGLHPALWEAVSFLSGRAVLLNTFFNLLAFAAFLRYLVRLNGWWMCLSLFSFICALLSHEAYMSATAVFVFYVACVMKDNRTGVVRWLILLPFAVITVLFALIRHGLTGFDLSFLGNISEPARQCMNVLKVLFIELGILIAPFKVHFHQTTDAWQGFNDPKIILCLSVLAVIAFGLALLRKKIDGVVVFLLLWFLAGNWPLLKKAFLTGAQVVPLAVDGKMIYMSSIPLIALVLLLGERISLSFLNGRWCKKVIIIFILAGFGLMTFRHNILTSDEVAILQEARRFNPHSAILEYQLGVVHSQKGSLSTAQAHFERALALDANFTSAAMGLGKALYDQGKLIESAGAYESIRNPGRYREVLERNLRSVYISLVNENEKVILNDPKNISAHFSLGNYYDKLGDVSRAIATYQQVIDLDPEDGSGMTAGALRSQGLVFDRLGEAGMAQENFEKAQLLSSQVYQ